MGRQEKLEPLTVNFLKYCVNQRLNGKGCTDFVGNYRVSNDCNTIYHIFSRNT